MKLGKKYVAAIVMLTAALVVGGYMLESHNQRWVLAHPVLDGAIGGAIIVPITGVIALAVIDRRLDALARRERNAQAELVRDRLGSALRQSVRGRGSASRSLTRESVLPVHRVQAGTGNQAPVLDAC